MNPVKGHYSIVQYCPDLARRETVNIGVVLLVPERAFLQTRMVADNERVRHFFGTTGDDAKLLSDFKKSFSARIEAEHGRVATLEHHANIVPWQLIARETQGTTFFGCIGIEHWRKKIGKRMKAG